MTKSRSRFVNQDDDETELDQEDMPCNHPCWTHTSDDNDFSSALSYLSLCMSKKDAMNAVQALQKKQVNGKIEHYAPKDILRAARLDALPADNPEVERRIEMMNKGQKIGPPLIIRGDNGKAIIADGYHRTCAAYLDNMEAPIPCVVISD